MATASHLFHLERRSDVSLQTQIRQQLVAAIIDGYIPANERLPPSRVLARQLAVARNTIVQCYDRLKDDGYLISRERSGYYINPQVHEKELTPVESFKLPSRNRPDWQKRLRFRPSTQNNISKPSNWQNYPYPFIYGQIDHRLFPLHSWRECWRDAVSVNAVRGWTGDYVDRDDSLLVEQIRIRMLSRRGVRVDPDEILVTVGAQHALYLLARLLFAVNRAVGLENPGYVDIRNIAKLNPATTRPLCVDGSGLIVDRNLAQCDYVYVTPSHQSPTTVTMPIERRYELLMEANDSDIVIIEDDYDSELSFSGTPTPALKSLDSNDRVIYVGSLSKTLAPGLRIGYLVAPKPLVNELRVLRRLMVRHPPANNQRAAALFLERGYHDSLLWSLIRVYEERAEILRKALLRYLPEVTHSAAIGGSSLWIRAPETISARKLQSHALKSGILIEAGDLHFFRDNRPLNYFRLGYSSIVAENIEEGVRALAKVLHSLT